MSQNLHTLYSLKVFLFRFMIVGLATIGWILYNAQLEDYILLIVIILAFGSIFPVSYTGIQSDILLIRKNYCWGIFPVKKRLPLTMIQSIHPKDYSIQTYRDLDAGSGNIFIELFFDFTKPKVNWLVSKITYLANGDRKTIEVNVKETIFMQIENSILAQIVKKEVSQ